MSLESWKKEFYPTPASDFIGGGQTAVGAVQHSLKKWEGTTPLNLANHHLSHIGQYLQDDSSSTKSILTSEGCSLCVGYYRNHECRTCPITLYKKEHGEKIYPSYACQPQYEEAMSGRTIPMIELLKATLNWTQQHPAPTEKPTA